MVSDAKETEIGTHKQLADNARAMTGDAALTPMWVDGACDAHKLWRWGQPRRKGVRREVAGVDVLEVLFEQRERR